ncbi:MAG: hypothetical protein ACLFRG_23620 [Desulfococcaceae bacterium]
MDVERRHLLGWGTNAAIFPHQQGAKVVPRKEGNDRQFHEGQGRRNPGHDAAFWNEVDNILPDYPERKEWLRRKGAAGRPALKSGAGFRFPIKKTPRQNPLNFGNL